VGKKKHGESTLNFYEIKNKKEVVYHHSNFLFSSKRSRKKKNV